MKTIDGVTFDERKIYLSEDIIYTLKEFFSDPEIIKLVDENNWDIIFIKYDEQYMYRVKVLTEFLVKAEVEFLPYVTNFRKVFEGCESLYSIVLPNTLTTIPDFAFNKCELLKSITLPGKLMVIDEYAFSNCSSLESITLPNTLTTILSYAFVGCTSLSEIKYLGTKAQWKTIDRDRSWRGFEHNIKKIVCKDGDINLK